MLVSGVQQCDSVIHIRVSIFQILFPFRLLYNMEQSPQCYTVGPCWLFILNMTMCICSVSGFPGGSVVKKLACQCRRCGFDPCIRKIPWRRKWQPAPVVLLWKLYGQRSLVGYSSRSHNESDTTLVTEHTQNHMSISNSLIITPSLQP